MKNYFSVTLAAFLMFVVGCKGPTGSQGGTGPQGAAGAPGGLPDGVLYKGTVTSDTYTVPITGLDVSQGDLLAVYACTNLNNLCEQLNLYVASLPANVSFIETTGAVQLDNLLADNLPNYYITVIIRH